MIKTLKIIQSYIFNNRWLIDAKRNTCSFTELYQYLFSKYCTEAINQVVEGRDVGNNLLINV